MSPPPRRIPKSELSKIPSWIMLGFVAGALGVLSLERSRERGLPPPVPAKNEPIPAVAPLPPPPSQAGQRLPDIDAVFGAWAEFAVWENDLTEVALINSQTGDYTDYYEVIRFAERYFFRPVDRPTRPLIEAAVSRECPLRFTEPPALRAERLARDFKVPPAWLETPAPPRPKADVGASTLDPAEPPAPRGTSP